MFSHNGHTNVKLIETPPPPLTTSSLDTYINLILLPLGLLIPDDGGSTHL
jgi:hypothetical protein